MQYPTVLRTVCSSREVHNIWWNSICTIVSMKGVKDFFEVCNVYTQLSLAFCALFDAVLECGLESTRCRYATFRKNVKPYLKSHYHPKRSVVPCFKHDSCLSQVMVMLLSYLCCISEFVSAIGIL